MVVCTALLAGCSQPPPPLLTDSEPWLAVQKTKQFEQSASTMGRAQAEDVERHVEEVPDDAASRMRLLIFYAAEGTRFYDPAKVVAARRKHILWLVQHRPEEPLLGERPGLINPPIDQLADPAGYAQISRLWQDLANKPDAPLAILGNAAAFLADSDKPEAEKYLLAARAKDPEGPWAARLGALYASALAGPDEKYAAHVRDAVAKVIDPVVLANAHHHAPAEGSLLAKSQQAVASYDQGEADGIAAARKNAQEVLQAAAASKNDPDAATAAYQANIVMGLVALQDHNRQAALKYLQDAGNSPVTEELAYIGQPVTYRLLSWLLKDGERESVAQFLERFAKTSVVDRKQLLESAVLVRKNQKPAWYPAG